MKAVMAERYGRLRVLDRAGTHSHGEIIYLCRCDCGTRRTIRGGSLRAGRTTSCGKCQRPTGPAHNVTPVAEVYGRLRVLGRAGVSRDGEALYRCACACGSKLVVRGRSLRSGRTQSCGCLRDERVAEAKKRWAFRRRAAKWFRGKEGAKES